MYWRDSTYMKIEPWNVRAPICENWTPRKISAMHMHTLWLPYFRDQTPRLLKKSLCQIPRRLFEGGNNFFTDVLLDWRTVPRILLHWAWKRLSMNVSFGCLSTEYARYSCKFVNPLRMHSSSSLSVCICYHSYCSSVSFSRPSVISTEWTRYLQGYWFEDFAKSCLFKGYGVVYLSNRHSHIWYTVESHTLQSDSTTWDRTNGGGLLSLTFARRSSLVSVHVWPNDIM